MTDGASNSFWVNGRQTCNLESSAHKQQFLHEGRPHRSFFFHNIFCKNPSYLNVFFYSYQDLVPLDSLEDLVDLVHLKQSSLHYATDMSGLNCF